MIEMWTYHVVFEAGFEDGLLALVNVSLSVDELWEELCEEGVHVNSSHVVDARGDLLPQEGVAVGHQHVEQHSQEVDYQVLREDRLLVQLPPGMDLFQGGQVLTKYCDVGL